MRSLEVTLMILGIGKYLDFGIIVTDQVVEYQFAAGCSYAHYSSCYGNLFLQEFIALGCILIFGDEFADLHGCLELVWIWINILILLTLEPSLSILQILLSRLYLKVPLDLIPLLFALSPLSFPPSFAFPPTFPPSSLP